MTWALLGFGLVMGVDPRRLGLLALAIFYPLVVMAGVIGVLMLAGRRSDSRPALFCEGVATELRSGSSLRQAMAASARAVGCPALSISAAEMTLADTATVAAGEFPGVARELEITIVNAARTGSGAADLFDEVGALALAQEEIRREVKVAAAPARAAATVFVALPALFIAFRWSSGGLGEYMASSGQRVMVSIGLALFLVGVGIAGVLVWRAK